MNVRPEEHKDESSSVRPYVITGGRTRATDSDLPVEAVVRVSDATRAASLTLERRTIAQLCETPQSIAELAGLLDVPLGVARVLVSDMAYEGLLRTDATADPSDAAFIRQLIEGIRSL